MQSYNFEPACWSADKNGLDNINECPLGLLSFDGQNNFEKYFFVAV